MKKLRLGLFGTGRGLDIAQNFMLLNCDIVAACDSKADWKENAAKKLGGDTAFYDDFDSFLNHDMDGVILANFFHEHAPYAVKCLEKGLHVYSECLSNSTMAQGVELIRAAEKSRGIYMLAENYPQMKFNREMKRICDEGTLGKILYAEGEYNHPFNQRDVHEVSSLRPYPLHWRNYTPKTYYITHSLGPVMHITGATPKRVSAFASFAPPGEDVPSGVYCGDQAAIITTQNDDGSVFRVTAWSEFGAHHSSYRICGTEGQVENLRGMNDKVMLRYNKWSTPEGKNGTQLYEAEWNDPDEALIKKSGHGGGDFLTARTFTQCIREGKQPPHPFDVHSAVTMASVAILAHRSTLEGGKPYDIPDFHLEECRMAYENDRLSPFYGSDGSEPTIPCCSHPDYKPTEKQLEQYEKQIKAR